MHLHGCVAREMSGSWKAEGGHIQMIYNFVVLPKSVNWFFIVKNRVLGKFAIMFVSEKSKYTYSRY